MCLLRAANVVMEEEEEEVQVIGESATATCSITPASCPIRTRPRDAFLPPTRLLPHLQKIPLSGERELFKAVLPLSCHKCALDQDDWPIHLQILETRNDYRCLVPLQIEETVGQTVSNALYHFEILKPKNKKFREMATFLAVSTVHLQKVLRRKPLLFCHEIDCASVY